MKGGYTPRILPGSPKNTPQGWWGNIKLSVRSLDPNGFSNVVGFVMLSVWAFSRFLVVLVALARGVAPARGAYETRFMDQD